LIIYVRQDKLYIIHMMYINNVIHLLMKC